MSLAGSCASFITGQHAYKLGMRPGGAQWHEVKKCAQISPPCLNPPAPVHTMGHNLGATRPDVARASVAGDQMQVYRNAAGGPRNRNSGRRLRCRAGETQVSALTPVLSACRWRCMGVQVIEGDNPDSYLIPRPSQRGSECRREAGWRSLLHFWPLEG